MDIEFNNENFYTIIAKKCEEKEINVDFFASLTEHASYAYFDNGVGEIISLSFDRYDTPAAVLNSLLAKQEKNQLLIIDEHELKAKLDKVFKNMVLLLEKKK